MSEQYCRGNMSWWFLKSASYTGDLRTDGEWNEESNKWELATIRQNSRMAQRTDGWPYGWVDGWVDGWNGCAFDTEGTAEEKFLLGKSNCWRWCCYCCCCCCCCWKKRSRSGANAEWKRPPASNWRQQHATRSSTFLHLGVTIMISCWSGLVNIDPECVIFFCLKLLARDGSKQLIEQHDFFFGWMLMTNVTGVISGLLCSFQLDRSCVVSLMQLVMRYRCLDCSTASGLISTE